MRYLLMIYSQETTQVHPPEVAAGIMAAHRAVIEESGRKGVLLAVDRLKPTNTATTVRIEDGKAIVTDGPFAETKEQLAGYYIMECNDLDEAIEWAKRIPSSCRGVSGCIEIRPIDKLPERD